MGSERVEGTVRRGQELDPEPLEECSGAELLAAEARDQATVDVVSRAGTKGVLDAEDCFERVVEPEFGRRPREEVVVLGQFPPDLLPVHSGRWAAPWTDTECFETDALAVHEAQEVVVPRDQLERRVGPPRVLGQLDGAAVTVRAHDRHGPRRLVQASCHLPNAGFSGEEAVWMHHGCKALQSLVGSATLRRRRPESSHV